MKDEAADLIAAYGRLRQLHRPYAPEFDRVDVGLDAMVVHLSSVPYFQCQECDHRQMVPESQERLGEGLEAFLASASGLGDEVMVMLEWREVFALDLGGPAADRSYEVDWLLL